MCNIGKIESVRSVQALIFASGSNFFPKVCSCRFDMRLHIDNFIQACCCCVLGLFAESESH